MLPNGCGKDYLVVHLVIKQHMRSKWTLLFTTRIHHEEYEGKNATAFPSLLGICHLITGSTTSPIKLKSSQRVSSEAQVRSRQQGVRSKGGARM